VRVFLDANILFSASNPKWLTSLLLDVLELHGELVTSEFAAQEARRNVAAFSEDLMAWKNGSLACTSWLIQDKHHRRWNLQKKTGQVSMPRFPEIAPTFLREMPGTSGCGWERAFRV
jgi:hypothetical protein